MAKERAANLGANDICEKLALDEFAPALNDYTKAQNETFALLESTPIPTTQAISSLSTLSDRVDADFRRMRAYSAKSKSHGCD